MLVLVLIFEPMLVLFLVLLTVLVLVLFTVTINLVQFINTTRIDDGNCC